MRRVLIGDFGVIARLGLREVLEEGGFDVVAEGFPGGVISRLTDSRPDVVVVDLDDEGGTELAGRIASLFPATKVIACSSREPTMRVYPPFHGGEWYSAELSSTVLAEAVRS